MKGERGRSFRSKRKREGYLVGQQKEENRRPLQKLKRMNCQISQMIVPNILLLKMALFENDKANPQSWHTTYQSPSQSDLQITISVPPAGMTTHNMNTSKIYTLLNVLVFYNVCVCKRGGWGEGGLWNTAVLGNDNICMRVKYIKLLRYPKIFLIFRYFCKLWLSN